jgi:mono/diheme cytochrome c family protein
MRMVAGLAAAALALGAAAHDGTPNGRLHDAPPRAQQQTAPAGKAVFEGKGTCYVCHGRDAKGTPLGPDLTDGEWLNGSGKLEEILAVVRAGVPRPKKYPAPMLPMGGARLTRAELEAVAQYVYDLSRPGAAPAGR